MGNCVRSPKEQLTKNDHTKISTETDRNGDGSEDTRCSDHFKDITGGKKSHSVDEGSGSLEFHLDPKSKKLLRATSSLSPQNNLPVPPKFIVKPRRQLVDQGETAKFKVTFDGSPDTEVCWFVNGKPVINDGRHRIYREDNRCILEIHDAQPSDQGTIVCKLENVAGSAQTETELEVLALPQQKSTGSGARTTLAPTVDMGLQDTEFLDREKDCILTCTFHDATDAKVTWYKDNKEVSKRLVTPSFDGRTATLVIKEASRRVCGVYECVVQNLCGEAKTSCLVNVLDPSVQAIPPSFIRPLSDQTIEVGERLVLQVDVTGKPKPTLTWYQDQMELKSSDSVKLEYKDGNGHAMIDSLLQAKETKFSCVARNMAGEETTIAKVSVTGPEESREPPIFIQELHDMEVNDGERVELSVEVKGTPPVDVVWVHNNREIPASDPVCRMMKEGNVHTLVIPEVFPEDCGEYVCEAYNEFGDTDTFCRLTVNPEKETPPKLESRPPEFITRPEKVQVTKGNSAILKCKVSGEPPPSVTWSKGTGTIKHGDHYKLSSIGEEHFLEIFICVQEDSGQYTCTLSNIAGSTSVSARIVVADNTHHKSVPTDFRNVLKRYQKAEEESPKLERKHHSDPRPTKSDALQLLNGNLKPTTSPQQIPEKKREKGGVQQIDFRDVLKQKPLNNTNKTLTNPSSAKSNSLNTNLQNGDQDKVLRRSSPKLLSDRRLGDSDKALDKSPKDSNLKLQSGDLDVRHRYSGLYTIEPKSKGQFKTSRSFPSNLSNLGNQLTPIDSARNNLSTHSDSKINDTPKGYSSLRTTRLLNNTGDTKGINLNDKAKSDNDLTGSDSNKVVKNKDNTSGIKSKAGNLSQKRDFFEKCDSKVADLPPKSVHSSKSPSTVKSGNKVNEFLQKFENSSKETSPKSEARIPLKDRRESKTQLSLTIADRSRTWKPPDKLDLSKSDRRFTKTHSLESQKPELQYKHIPRGKSVELPKMSSLSLNNQDVGEVPSIGTGNLIADSNDLTRNTDYRSGAKENVSNRLGNQSKDTQGPSKVGESKTRVKEDWSNRLQNQSRDFSDQTRVTDIKSRVNKEWSSKVDSQSKETSSSRLNDNQPRVTQDWSRVTGDIKPEFDAKLEDKSVVYGSEVILECGITGTPKPSVAWALNNKQIKQSKFFKMSYHDKKARLVISEVFSEDEGEYTCTAQNTAGSNSSSCRLTVQKDNHKTPENSDTEEIEEPFSPTATPPKVYNISPSNFCILRGGMIEFKASYTSVPAGKVTWCKNKQEIETGGRMSIDTSEHFSTLTITNIQQEDKGRYEICVENKLGEDVADAWLAVEDVPEPPVGEPCVSEVTLTSVILSWYGPAYDGGCTITNYRVEICDAEEQEWTCVTNSCKNTSFKIENLNPLTPYFFRIFAENKHGLSPPCMTPEVTVTRERRPSLTSRLNSVESDDVFTHDTNDVCTPSSEYAIVSPLSPDEIPFEHREVTVQKGRSFDQFYDCQEEIGKGKFGYVYKCTEKSTGQQWAAKILKCRESEKKKIQQEVEVMNQLKHPKILMLWDVFEAPRKMVLVMELIGGGELFERVLDDDFELTERDCIQFMRQILDAVNYMHNKNILHLDLKPENILCVKNESNKVKIIDFGLARFYQPGENVRVLFGTPEFVAPEVVNYDEIGFTTDMWSLGVICYVLLTGLSPFMGDNDAETLSNVTQGDYDFDDESFDNVSDDGKDFIDKLLVKNKRKRLTSKQALDHRWLAEDAARLKTRKINTKNLKRFMARRKWQKTGNAIRALGRMTNLQKFTRPNPNNTSSPANNSVAGSPISSSSSTLTMGSQGTIVEEKSTSLKVSDAEDVERENTDNGKADVNEVTNGVKDEMKNNKPSMDINSNVSKLNTVNKTMCSDEKSDLSMHSVNKKFQFDQKHDLSNEITMVSSNHSSANNNKSDHPHEISDPDKGVTRKSLDFESKNYKCPEFTKEMIESKAFPGDIVRFDVAYLDKSSHVNVTWYFEDDIIHEGPRHYIQETVEGSCSLIIKDICEEDDGEYSCKIQNDFGEDTCSAELIVYGAI